ncbi:MAG: DUF2905 domain-containing protein [Thermodesulfobacteriota bacterium]
MPDIGRTLVFLGIVLVVLGCLFMLLSRTGLPLGLGRLPGDVLIKRDNFTVYLPITSSILVSVVLSVIFWLLRR